MYKVIWYAEALEELEQIYNYYYIINPNTADKIYMGITSLVKYLKDHPNIAPIESYLDDIQLIGQEEPFRSLVTKDGLFKIVYYVDGDEIVISRVWSCRQDPAKLKVKA